MRKTKVTEYAPGLSHAISQLSPEKPPNMKVRQNQDYRAPGIFQVSVEEYKYEENHGHGIYPRYLTGIQED